MAATANPPTKAVGEWCKVFHAQGTENYTSSVTFMKQLSVVAISIITYMKNAFPENCYTMETFAGLKLKILKSKCQDEYAQFLSSALTQAFDALDKKYLHQLALCFYEDTCTIDNLVEYHIFEYTYNSEGVTMNIHSKNRNSQKQSVKCTFEDIKKQTTLLIRTCIVMMQACQQQLPETADVSIRLYYNDGESMVQILCDGNFIVYYDNDEAKYNNGLPKYGEIGVTGNNSCSNGGNDAPEGYQAPGFRCAESDLDHLEPTRAEAVQLGVVETPYHKLRAKSYMRDSIRDSHEAIPSQNPPVLTQQVEFSGSAQRSASETSDLQLNCPCNKYEDVGTYPPPLLIVCQYCGRAQHAACFGLLREHVRTLRTHCCARCGEVGGAGGEPGGEVGGEGQGEVGGERRVTDLRLAQLSDRKRECLCIFRRTLEWCLQLPAVDGGRLMDRFGISAVNASKLIKLLDSYGIIQLEPNYNLVTPMKINNEALQRQIKVYFRNDDDNLPDRLLAETFGSQESKDDPIAEVLSPMEKVTLQNTSNLGRVIENPATAAMDTEDATLKQYREAILAGGGDVDLPMSDVKDIVIEGKKSVKRKIKDTECKVDKRLRSGVRNKQIKGDKQLNN